MGNEFLIHQTVHGYSEGHRLLATSNQLSEIDQRTLLRLSDRSGDIVKGFDEYLTGYPLPDSNFFALAKTWHAPEMERPGCVWTHTLLIEREYFQYLTNIHPITSLFNRPQKGRPFTNYKKPLSFVPPNNEDGDFIFPWSLEADNSEFKTLYRELFRQLYEKIKNVVLLAGEASRYEDFVLSVWCQQWPALRAQFTFCTGSISGRSIQKRPFTLQISPYRNHSLLVHKYPNLTFIDLRTEEVGSARISKNEDYRILRHKNDPLIQFVWHYGAQMKPLRKNFGWLAKFYNLTHEARQKPLQISDITEFLASKFPSATEMTELKVSLYGGDVGSATYVTPLGDEVTLLAELFKTKHAGIFDISKLNIYQRALNLWETSQNDAISIARNYHSRMGLNPIRQEYLQATSKQLQPNQAYELFADKLPLQLKLIEYNPELAATAALWSESYKARLKIFEIISKPMQQASLDQDIYWHKIAVAMLEANTDDFTDHLYKVLNDELITIVLDWHSQAATNSLLKHGWTTFFERHPHKLIKWVVHAKDAPWTKALVAKYLSPHSSEVRQHGSFPWLDLTGNGSSHIPHEDRVPVMAFLLALGFMNLDQDSYRLVEASFQSVYGAAAAGSIPHRSWSYLDKLAPSEAYIFEWDKCRRLEEALISRVLKNNWPDELILTASGTPQVIWNILKRADSSSKGRKLLWRIYDKVKEGRIEVISEHRAIFEKFLQIKE